jgi:hypothetical protein
MNGTEALESPQVDLAAFRDPIPAGAHAFLERRDLRNWGSRDQCE